MEGRLPSNRSLLQISCECKVLYSSDLPNNQWPKSSTITLDQKNLSIRATDRKYAKTHCFSFETKDFHHTTLSLDKKDANFVFKEKPKIFANVQMQEFIPENL